MRWLSLLLGICLSMVAHADAHWDADAKLFLHRNAPSDGYPYRLYAPPHVGPHEKLPLIVFLHGSGQNGDNNEDQIADGANGAMQLLDAARAQHKRILFAAPQSPQDYWVPGKVMAVIADIEQRWPVDRDRVVLTGLSSGGTGVWDVAMGKPKYDQGHGDDLHRRSLYTFWKRSVAPPAMLAFDAPDHNYCVARRQSTSTPLQALVLLNDIQITESARFISQRALQHFPDSPEQRILYTFKSIADRDPTATELSILKRLYQEQYDSFSADLNSAKKLLSVGESKTDPSLDPIDLATGTVLAEALLNSDDAIMRR